MTGSLSYRKNTDAIWRGHAPEKYTRLLPYIKGERILEIGAAEGVLALLLAERGHKVIALELTQERHQEALRLKQQWLDLGRAVEDCAMLQGDIRDRLNLMDGVDTLVAVRTIYHLHGDALAVLKRAPERVVLCGNKNRAQRFMDGQNRLDDGVGEWNRYASINGMSELLDQAGFEVETIVAEGDPIVTGRRRQSLAV